MDIQHPNETVRQAVAPEVPWRMAYPFVEGAVRRILDTLPADAVRISTTVLVDMIYDPDGPVDERVRTRIFKALRACAEHGLRDYYILGEPAQIGGVKDARPKLWGAPVKSGTYCCPKCGRPL